MPAGSSSPQPSQMSGSSSRDHHNDASSPIIQEELKYLYASNTNVCNFVSVKLSSEGNYHLWKTQMLCLMKSHNMGGLANDTFASPKASSEELKNQYDSLLKGWIFGSVSENVLGAVVDMFSAKDVWDKLKSLYDVTVSLQQDEVTPEPQTTFKEATARDIEANSIDTQTRTEGLKDRREKLHKATLKGDWDEAESILKNNKDAVREAISNDGSTILHLAVGIGHIDFVKKLISYLKDEDLLKQRSSDGSTALHIAAIVGNIYAVRLLTRKNRDLLKILDHNGKGPLQKAYENMHLDAIGCRYKICYEQLTNMRNYEEHVNRNEKNTQSNLNV